MPCTLMPGTASTLLLGVLMHPLSLEPDLGSVVTKAKDEADRAAVEGVFLLALAWPLY